MFMNERLTLTGPRASSLSKCIPLLVMLPPLLLSIVLLSYQNHVVIGSWRRRILENPSAVSALRQVVSGTMGTLQASAVLAILFNFPARTRLAHPHKPIKLDTLGLLNALSVPRMDWSLPRKNWLLVCLAVGLGHGPAALWASAITPIPTTNVRARGSALLPSFTEASQDVWAHQLDNTYGVNFCQIQNTSSGYASNCPVPYYQNALLDSAREATTLNGAPRNHTKLDNPIWSYRGRSYGAGSSLGLASVSEIPVDFQLKEFSFEEYGYTASVNCNYTSEPYFLRFEYKQHQGSLGIFRLHGKLSDNPDKNDEPTIAWCHGNTKKACNKNAALIAWRTATDHQNQSVVGMAATAWYKPQLSEVLCSIEFAPTKFRITANVTDSSIIVSSDGNVTQGLEPPVLFVQNAVKSLHFLSKMSHSLYVSVLGDTFQTNINTTISRYPEKDPKEAALEAIGASFEAILDDILSVYGGGQVAIARSTTNAPIEGSFDSFHFGKPLIHNITLLVNLVILLFIMFEGVRTKFWRDLPRYDIMNFKSTVAAPSFGGKAISEKIRQQQKPGRKWTADSGDQKLGEIEVCLSQDESSEPKIILSKSPYEGGLLMQDEPGKADMEVEMEEVDPLETEYTGAHVTPAWSPIG